MKRHGLVATDKCKSSEGSFPTSITERDGLVYVRNSKGTGRIAGFRLSDHGILTHIEGSVVDTLAPELASGQVGFIPGQNQILFSVKTFEADDFFAGGGFLVYDVSEDGLLSDAAVTNRPGFPQFSFDFAERDGSTVVIATDVFLPDEEYTDGGLTSYVYDADTRTLVNPQFTKIDTVIEGSVVAPCWVKYYKGYVYTANTGDSTTTVLRVEDDASLTLLERKATFLDLAANLDMEALNGYLFQLYPGPGYVGVYRIEDDGSLTQVDLAPGHNPLDPIDLGLETFNGTGSSQGIGVIAR